MSMLKRAWRVIFSDEPGARRTAERTEPTPPGADGPNIDLMLQATEWKLDASGRLLARAAGSEAFHDSGITVGITVTGEEAGAAQGALPGEPPQALLISMACQADHAFGFLDKAEQQHRMRIMRRVYQEVAGSGQFRPELEEKFLSMLNPESYSLRRLMDNHLRPHLASPQTAESAPA